MDGMSGGICVDSSGKLLGLCVGDKSDRNSLKEGLYFDKTGTVAEDPDLPKRIHQAKLAEKTTRSDASATSASSSSAADDDSKSDISNSTLMKGIQKKGTFALVFRMKQLWDLFLRPTKQLVKFFPTTLTGKRSRMSPDLSELLYDNES